MGKQKIIMNTYRKWLIIVGVVVVLATVGWLYMLYSQAQAEAIDEQAGVVGALVNSQVPKFVTAGDFTNTDPKHTAQVFLPLWNAVQSPEYVRMKVWTPDYTVIWSNLPELIGQKFAPFSELPEAAASKEPEGDLESQKAENVGERQYDVLLETYVPFVDANGNVPGFIELYEVPTAVNALIMTDFDKQLPLPIAIAIIVYALFAYGLHLFLKKKAVAVPPASTPVA